MAGKGAKKRNSKDSTKGKDNKKTKSKKRKNGASGGGSSGTSKSSKFHGDIFGDGAMENAYLVCHNVQDVLKARGFPWPEAKKKKGKRK